MFQAGDYNTTETVDIPFNSFTSDDPSASVTIANLVAGDVEIHKDGNVAQRASDNGVTVSIDFDGVTGNHMVHINLSDNSDAGYYANGSRFAVRMEGTTIDGATINAWIGAFSIGCTLRPTIAGRTVDVESTGEVGLDFNNIKDATGAHTLTNITVPVTTTNSDMRGTDSAALAATALSTAVWTAARAGALTDLIDGGRLDLLIDAIKTAAERLTAARAGALTDWIDGGRLDLLLDAIPTTAMRGTDGANTVVPPTVAQMNARTLLAASYGTAANQTAIKAITDALPDAGALNDLATIVARLTAARAGYLDELAAANIPADVDQIKGDLPQRLTKNTALTNFEFLLVDSTDHITGITAMVVTAQRSIDGGAFANCANAVAEVALGVYKINLAASDLNGDVITFIFTAVGADARVMTVVTQP